MTALEWTLLGFTAGFLLGMLVQGRLDLHRWKRANRRLREITRRMNEVGEKIP